MAFNGVDERIAFGTMAKGQKKYGSTSSRLRRNNEHVVVYNVQRGDTLAGIAIKFGVTTEQIRRANQLWTNDSLFLRDKLLIPVEKGSEENEEGIIMEADLSSSSGISVSNNHGGTMMSSSTTPLGENGSFKMQPHWSHPLCDSFESEDCVVSSPLSVNLELSNNGACSSLDESVGGHSSSTNWSSSGQNSSSVVNLNTSYGGGDGDQFGRRSGEGGDDSFVTSNNNGKGAIRNGGGGGGGGHNNQQLLLKNSKHYSSMDYGPTYQSSSDMFFTSSTAPGTPGSPSSSSAAASPRHRRSVVDHSEKSAEEFLSRIDTAIASSKMQAMNKSTSEQDKPMWVTFDSDSESDHRNNTSSSSGTSINRQGRHLRYSLRKLEKAQEELFQL